MFHSALSVQPFKKTPTGAPLEQASPANAKNRSMQPFKKTPTGAPLEQASQPMLKTAQCTTIITTNTNSINNTPSWLFPLPILALLSSWMGRIAATTTSHLRINNNKTFSFWSMPPFPFLIPSLILSIITNNYMFYISVSNNYLLFNNYISVAAFLFFMRSPLVGKSAVPVTDPTSFQSQHDIAKCWLACKQAGSSSLTASLFGESSLS